MSKQRKVKRRLLDDLEAGECSNSAANAKKTKPNTASQASRMCVAAILKLRLPPSLHKGL